MNDDWSDNVFRYKGKILTIFVNLESGVLVGRVESHSNVLVHTDSLSECIRKFTSVVDSGMLDLK